MTNLKKNITRYLRLLCLVAMLAAAPAAMAFRVVAPSADTTKQVSAYQILDEARKHLGKPYRWGGKGPNAFDCAGFVRFVYGKFGYSLAPSAGPQYKQGRPLTDSELEPGDLVFYGGRGKSRSIGHVGIVTEVLENGSFNFIHAARTGVRISHSSEHYYDMRYICACRVLNTQISGEGSGFDPAELEQYFNDNEKVYAYVRGTDITNKLDVKLVEIEEEEIPDTLELAFVGGIQTRKCSILGEMSCNPLPIDNEHILQDANVAIGMLNGPMSNAGNRLTKRFGSRHRHQMSPQCALELLYSGIDIMSLSSQYSMDLGLDGVQATMNSLDSVDIRYAGVRGICQTTVVERNGFWYGFCSFGHNGASPDYMDMKEVRSFIQSIRDTVDILVVTFAPVDEYKIADSSLYWNLQETFAHTAIDFGADIVVGCSQSRQPHAESYNGHLVYYGLGNYCGENLKANEILKVKILQDGTFLEGSLVPVFYEDHAEQPVRKAIDPKITTK